MATVTQPDSPPTSSPSNSNVVLHKLQELRRKLTSWILVRGLGRWLLALLLFLAADMLLDRVFKMDFAQRSIMLAVIALFAVSWFVWKVIRPLLTRPNDDSLIYQVEAKHPELQENLISSWQLSRDQNLAAAGVSEELTQATIRTGIEKANQVDFGKSLDLTHHRQNWLLLVGGLVVTSLLAVGVAQPNLFQTDFFRTWFSRNVMLSNDQWPQGTYLDVAGVVDGKLILPRGADHRQIVRITDASTVPDVNVDIEVDNPGGRTIHGMKPTGKLDGRERAFMFHNVSSTFRFRAQGGDDVTDWIDVQLVEPPAVIELALKSQPPAYTQIESIELSGNGPHAVLAGSGLEVRIKSNKPLRSALLKLDDESMKLLPIGRPEIKPEGAAKKDAVTGFDFAISISGEQLRGGEYEFELLDEMGLTNSRSSKFTLTTKEDKPPQVRATLLGISGLVAPRAMIPTSFQVADDYGLTRLYFDAAWKSGDDDQPPVTRHHPIADLTSTDGPITRKADDVAVLDLLPWNLTPGTSLRFSVAADDTCPETTGTGKSQEFLLRVVSEVELRADLLRREVEQREAFEQAYEVQMELATEIQAVAARQRSPGVTAEQFQAQRELELIELVRNQKSIGTAVTRVKDRFEEFLVEVSNNRLDEDSSPDGNEDAFATTQKIATRFEQGIIEPIDQLDRELISLATRNLDNCRRELGDDDRLRMAVDQTDLVHQQILEEMKRILSTMNDAEDVQALINELLEIKRISEEVKRRAGDELKPKDIFEDTDGIFE